MTILSMMLAVIYTVLAVVADRVDKVEAAAFCVLLVNLYVIATLILHKMDTKG